MNPYALYIIHFLVQVLFIMRVILRPHRQPASRIAWIAVILALPFIGMIIYLLLGETSIGRKRAHHRQQTIANLLNLHGVLEYAKVSDIDLPPIKYLHLSKLATSISQFSPVGGNRATLLESSNATIDALVADIDSAKEHVHLLFYIWLTDNNGLKVIAAVKRAAARGVTCRVMVDGLGSRALTRSKHWLGMREGGVHAAVALPIGNTFFAVFFRRIDLRNHRKIVVIDDQITYCGSQNCADPEFRVKAKFAPWVDAMMRFEGPIAKQNQFVFASDWIAHTNEDLNAVLLRPVAAKEGGFVAQVVATGPSNQHSAMPRMFESLIHAGRDELTITTPYYVPDEAIQDAICTAAGRGVKTTIIFPERNDSWIVGGASRSYYQELLDAGVIIYEYSGGLLHTKSLTVDGRVGLIGSANMDRRSFDLNYENNILFFDSSLAAVLKSRQIYYIVSSKLVTSKTIKSWSVYEKLWHNTLAMLGPVL